MNIESMDPRYFYILIPVAYLLGSVPSGVIISRLFGGVDPRSTGSGNIGATNVGRTSGKLPGVLTLAGDILKGVVPTVAALYIYPRPMFVSLVGLSAFIGHIFPVFLAFRGGKGVATACGIMFVVSPIATVASAVIFLVVVFLKRYVSLGSVIAASILPVFLSFAPGGKPYVPMGVVVAVLVIVKHRENIKRLIAGTENRL